MSSCRNATTADTSNNNLKLDGSSSKEYHRGGALEDRYGIEAAASIAEEEEDGGGSFRQPYPHHRSVEAVVGGVDPVVIAARSYQQQQVQKLTSESLAFAEVIILHFFCFFVAVCQ